MTHPDLILRGGRIHADCAVEPRGSAIAIAGGRVVAVGGDELVTLAGSTTRIEPLDGRTVIPGIVDAHAHLLHTGLVLGRVQLYGCRSIGEILDRVAAHVPTTPRGGWVLGRGWDESLLDERRHPTRHDLDRVAPETPVVLERVWNRLVCNSAALHAAGVDRSTPDPPGEVAYGGGFERDVAGVPTGLFRDRAKELILRHVPEPTPADLAAAVARACRAFNTVGITAVADPGLVPREIDAFRAARASGRLTVRSDLMVAGWGFGPADDDDAIDDRLGTLEGNRDVGDAWLRIEAVKILLDGGVGDRTARMFEEYGAEHGGRGEWVVDPTALGRRVADCHRRGWTVDIHTCGDEAQEVAVRALAAACAADPRALHHRVHHAYHPTAAAVELQARHRITAVCTIPFLRDLGESFVLSLGEERASRTMPTRTYLAAGVPLAFGSDTHVGSYDPWIGVEAAVTRRTIDGRALGPDEALTVSEALSAYTRGAADATGRRDIGTLAVGAAADLVVLDGDPWTTTPDELAQIRPLLTLVAGEVVHDAR